MEWKIDPIAFSIGPISVHWYGLCFGISFLLGYRISKRMFDREKISEKALESLFGYMMIGTIVGARLGHVLFYEPAEYFRDPLRVLKIWEGGLASHGGALGIAVALWIGARRVRVPSYLWLLDRVAIPAALGAFFIRIGNFFNSEILGRPSDVPWAVVFSRVDRLPRHPAQLYEAGSYLLIFILLRLAYERRRFREARGFLIGTFFVLVFSARIFIEFVKENQVGFENSMPLDMGQLLSFPVVALGAFLIWRSLRSERLDGAS